MYEYTHLIAEAKSRYSANLKPYASTHDILDTVEAFHQISFNYLSIPPVSIKTKPVLFILKRRENYKDFLENVTAAGPYMYKAELSEEASDILKLEAVEMEQTETIELEIETERVIIEKELLTKNHTKEVVDFPKESKSQEIYKRAEKNVTDEDTEPSESTTKKQQKGSIKKSIKKLISKYRRIKHDKVEDKSTSESSVGISTKVSVKKIIQQEKANVEKEELRKIQQQVISLIENNPNIINKDIIKEKLETTVMQELTSAIDPDAQHNKPYHGYRKKPLKLGSTLPNEPKLAEVDAKLSKLSYPKDSFDTAELKSSIHEEIGGRSRSPEVSRTKQDNAMLSDEKKRVQENAVDIYESPIIQNQEQSEETSELNPEFVDEDTELFPEPDIEAKLQFASEQIESLMTIISEIVDTIEVRGEESESR